MKIVPGVFVATEGPGTGPDILIQGHRIICAFCSHDSFRISVIYLSNGEHTHVTCVKCGSCFCDQQCVNGTPVFDNNKAKPEDN